MADAGDARRMQAAIDRLRAWDVVVREMSGWQARGLTFARVPIGVIDHHDASSIKSGEWGSLGYELTGPLAPSNQIQVARCLDGVPKVAVLAAGRCNHAGVGSWRFPDGVVVPTNDGNSWLYGVEKANDGISEDGNEAHHYAADAVFRALLEVCG
jgi:hypothetical protein